MSAVLWTRTVDDGRSERRGGDERPVEACTEVGLRRVVHVRVAGNVVGHPSVWDIGISQGRAVRCLRGMGVVHASLHEDVKVCHGRIKEAWRRTC